MSVQTKYLGKVKVDSKNIINFPNGLPGFAQENQFTIMDLPENQFFQILQSMKTLELAFIVTNPYQLFEDYTFKLDSMILEKLKIEKQEEVLVLSIMTLISPFNESTLNLKAPIIINVKQKLGKQYILNEEEYPTKAPIVQSKATQAKGEQ